MLGVAGVGVRSTWTRGAWGLLVGLVACTSPNPAYDALGSAGAAGSSTTGEVPGSSSPLSATGDPPGTTSEGPVETDASQETGTTASTETDGEEPQPPIVGPYDEPVLLEELSHPAHEDDDPTLTGDMLEIYFATLRPGGPGMDDIWFARRESVAAPWSTPEPVPGINSGLRDHTPEVSLDGLTMMLSSNRDTFDDEDVFMTTRRDREAMWGEPVRVEAMSTPERDVCAFVTADGLETYACTGPMLVLDIVRFERDAPGMPWFGPVVVEGLQTDGLDCGAWVDATKTTIAFFSDRQGPPTSTDLYVATRDDVGEPFGVPIPIEGLDSPWLDDDPWLSQDGSVVYFASDRPGTGPQDLYVATRR